MEFLGISQKSGFFTDEAQFHGECHIYEVANYVGPYKCMIYCTQVSLTIYRQIPSTESTDYAQITHPLSISFSLNEGKQS